MQIVYLYFLAHYPAILRLISRSRMQVFTLTFSLIIQLFLDLFLGLECKGLPLVFRSLSSYSQIYFQMQNARVYPYFLCHYQAILRLISRSRMQEFTLTFLLIIELYVDMFLGLECKRLPLLFGLLSSYSMTYFQVQNARVYPYFFSYYRAILRLISRSRMQGFTHTFFLIIELLLDFFLGLECKGLHLLSDLLSSHYQKYLQVQNARVYPFFFIKLFLDLSLSSYSHQTYYLGLECKDFFVYHYFLALPLLSSYSQTYFQVQNARVYPYFFATLSSYSQTYFQVQNARVYPYFLLSYYSSYSQTYFQVQNARMQGFSLNFLLIIELFLDLFLSARIFLTFLAYYQAILRPISRSECKGLHQARLSRYSQTYFQVQNARVYPYFLCHYQAILRLISRSRMQGFTLAFLLIIELFLDLFLGRECKGLPLISYLLSSYSQTYFQVENARVYTYFLAYYRAILRLISRSRMQGFTLTFWLIIQLFLDLFLGLECKSLPLLSCLLSSYSQTYFQVQNARVYPYFLSYYPAILRLISRSRMQGFTLTFLLIIELFLDLFLGLECKSLPFLLFGSLSRYSQTYLQVQNARVYPYYFAYNRAIIRSIYRSRMQGFTLTFCVIIKLFLDLFLGLECKSLPLLFCSLSSYTQTCFQVQNANDYPYFFAYYQAIL